MLREQMFCMRWKVMNVNFFWPCAHTLCSILGTFRRAMHREININIFIHNINLQLWFWSGVQGSKGSSLRSLNPKCGCEENLFYFCLSSSRTALQDNHLWVKGETQTRISRKIPSKYLFLPSLKNGTQIDGYIRNGFLKKFQAASVFSDTRVWM